MRFALVLAAVSASAFVGCASSNYSEDAGADRPPLSAIIVNVDSSGTSTCPGDLYGRASEGSATCTQTMERCVSDPSAVSAIECTCSGSSSTPGTWNCHQLGH